MNPTQPRPPGAFRRLLPYGSALLLLGLVYFVYAYFVDRPPADVCVVGRGTAISAVYGTVTVISKRTIVVNAQNSGILRMAPGFGTIVDSNGTTVKQGDLMATVTDDAADRALQQAQTDYDAAKAHLDLGPGSAKSLKITRDQLRAYDALPANNVPRVQREAARDDAIRLEMVVANEGLELQRQLDTAAGVLKTCRENIKRAEIRAPITGIIVVPYFNDGSFVGSGSPLFSISSQDLYVAGQVNEEDVGKLKPGMKAEMHLYAYGSTPFTATLSSVQPIPEPNTSRYTVTLYMDNPPANLLFGLTGEMNIILGRKEGALLLPARALLVDQVLLVQNGIVEQRTVSTGYRSLEVAEITEGLHEGDLVVLNDQDAFSPRERVRPVRVDVKPGGAARPQNSGK